MPRMFNDDDVEAWELKFTNGTVEVFFDAAGLRHDLYDFLGVNYFSA